VEDDYSFDVLLATFNGEKYLREFLESLSKQTRVDIHLIVSDDGSTDTTLKIVESCQDQFAKVTIIQGPKKGPSANFFHLLNFSQAKYIAFADQDDVWESDHLFESLKRIQRYNQPALSFTATREFGENVKSERIWPGFETKPKFPNALFENVARGCTMVINSPARVLLNRYTPKDAIMHDWWIFLVLLLQGEVLYCPSPEVRYRIHENNFVGVKYRREWLGLKSLLRGTWMPLSQISELVSYSMIYPEHKNLFELKEFETKLRGKFIDRLKLSLNMKNTFRNSRLDNFRFRLGIILMPLLSRNQPKIK
jgi:glycosyltransferase involved in cell wall biosynthesis